MSTEDQNVEIVYWDQVREDVEALFTETGTRNELFQIMDKLGMLLKEVGLSPKLARVSYPFGEYIVHNEVHDDENTSHSQLCLPSGEHLPSEFDYALVPLCLLMENAAEVFYPENVFIFTGGRTKGKLMHLHPIKIIQPGQFLGLFETLHYLSGISSDYSPWSVTAGARTVHFTVNTHLDNFQTKLEDVVGAAFGQSNSEIVCGDFLNASDWEIAKGIAKLMAPDWVVKMLIFSKGWIQDEPDQSQEIESGYKKEIDRLRTEFKNDLYGAGWLAAEPLLTGATFDTFYGAWKETCGNRKKLHDFAHIAYTLYEIDRGLRPVLVDVCHAISKPDQFKILKQLAPIETLLTALVLTGICLKHKHRATMFLPSPLQSDIVSFHTAYDQKRGEVNLKGALSTDFMKKLKILLSEDTIFAARNIDPSELLLVKTHNQPLITSKGVEIDINALGDYYHSPEISCETSQKLLSKYSLKYNSSANQDITDKFSEAVNYELNIRESMKWFITFRTYGQE
jgi:hypothetical protein